MSERPTSVAQWDFVCDHNSLIIKKILILTLLDSTRVRMRITLLFNHLQSQQMLGQPLESPGIIAIGFLPEQIHAPTAGSGRPSSGCSVTYLNRFMIWTQALASCIGYMRKAMVSTVSLRCALM